MTQKVKMRHKVEAEKGIKWRGRESEEKMKNEVQIESKNEEGKVKVVQATKQRGG